MITFKTVNEDVNMFDDAEGYADMLAADSLTNQISEVFKDNSCINHPDIESVIAIEFRSGKIIMKVKKYCCDNFNNMLIRITENENPFENKV